MSIEINIKKIEQLNKEFKDFSFIIGHEESITKDEYDLLSSKGSIWNINKLTIETWFNKNYVDPILVKELNKEKDHDLRDEIFADTYFKLKYIKEEIDKEMLISGLNIDILNKYEDILLEYQRTSYAYEAINRWNLTTHIDLDIYKASFKDAEILNNFIDGKIDRDEAIRSAYDREEGCFRTYYIMKSVWNSIEWGMYEEAEYLLEPFFRYLELINSKLDKYDDGEKIYRFKIKSLDLMNTFDQYTKKPRFEISVKIAKAKILSLTNRTHEAELLYMEIMNLFPLNDINMKDVVNFTNFRITQCRIIESMLEWHKITTDNNKDKINKIIHKMVKRLPYGEELNDPWEAPYEYLHIMGYIKDTLYKDK